MREFDVVIGMDWLGLHRATILCNEKIVWVRTQSGGELPIYGERKKGEFLLCSITKAIKYMSRGGQAYLAHVVDSSKEKKNLEDIFVVKEFRDIFLEELPGVPLDREVKFRIDLILGAPR